MNISIRKEEEKDYTEVESLLNKAFGQKNEGILVNRLRKNPDFIPELSLIAGYKGAIVGYILFFPILIVSGHGNHRSLALAPMAILPDFQKKGIGKKLIHAGLVRAEESGFSSIIVVGHPDYYPRFGFKPASRYNIKPPFNIPDNVFLARELTVEGLRNVSGTVHYPEEFNKA
jgi:predicted N-acetyltransferase YhbS